MWEMSETGTPSSLTSLSPKIGAEIGMKYKLRKCLLIHVGRPGMTLRALKVFHIYKGVRQR